jgi:hypothetical protein
MPPACWCRTLTTAPRPRFIDSIYATAFLLGSEPQNRAIDMPKAEAIRARRSCVGSVVPVSNCEIADGATPTMPANTSWVIPRNLRHALIR